MSQCDLFCTHYIFPSVLFNAHMFAAMISLVFALSIEVYAPKDDGGGGGGDDDFW